MDNLGEVLGQLHEMIQLRIQAIKTDRGIYAWDPDGVRHKYVIAQQTWCDGQIAAYQDLAEQITKLYPKGGETK